MIANQTQVGGSHYKDMKIQPVDYIHANGIGFIEGCVIKYVSRHKSKNGKQDLEKAIHFLQLLIEMEYESVIWQTETNSCSTLPTAKRKAAQ